MRYSMMKFLFLFALLFVFGCTGPSTQQSSASSGVVNCGNDVLCLKNAETSCKPAYGTGDDSGVAIYEEIKGITNYNECEINIQFEVEGGNALSSTCYVPMEIIQEGLGLSGLCSYCQGNMIDFFTSEGLC